MRHPPALLILAAALALGGCSQRERANPFDPGNPTTGGRPAGFGAVAGFSYVRLSWTPRPDLAIDGYEVVRFAAGDSVWRPLTGTLWPGSQQFLDTAVQNGRRYRYRLDYVVDGRPLGRPAEDEATPGPLRAWVADPGADELLRLSPDGRDVTLVERRFGTVGRIAVDPDDGFVWASASSDGLVWAFDPNSTLARSIPGVASPDAMALSPFDNSVWVCDRSGGVSHFRRDGSSPSPGRLSPLDDPAAIATCALDGSVWVCERGGNRVRHFSALGEPLGAAFVDAPARVAVDSLTRVAYVTSYIAGWIWRIGESGQKLDSTGVAQGPIGIAIDRPRGRVWVADEYGGRVLGLDLATLAVEVTVTNAGAPYDLAVDRATGEVWVVARADGAVVRLAPDGTRLDVLSGFTDPVEIRLDPGQ
jgi:DNA-binding beta-propeller fold protein YncE